MAIRVYTTKICPNCKKVKEFLAAEGEAYEEVDITTAEALTELRVQGVFTLFTPVVQIGSTFLTNHDLFNGDELRKERIKEVIKSSERDWHEKRL
jgi:glutaredoxin